MINELMIQERVAQILTENGYRVIAAEVDEGFKKPAVFVSVYPATLHREGPYMESVTDTVEIRYIPKNETVEHCAAAAQDLRNIFMYAPFEVSERKLTIQEMEFDVEDKALYVYFNLEYYRMIPTEEEYDEVETLEMGGI
jgi:hypothetical protein